MIKFDILVEAKELVQILKFKIAVGKPKGFPPRRLSAHILNVETEL
jgi:hypothetical protein